ncbi:hypothetical protein HIM_05366 [Hirsutella minnesotensis 3608]|uniref:Stress-response A/B barrel domain-containing protein n=1 Tax=Hirsutella minnesotensis 3608 TaxID=1043627 RepID=A0A0F8A0A5_9HYPO|nr:hypothetical protein HIM_05366 [Hirsutella minnesotensis 3608]
MAEGIQRVTLFKIPDPASQERLLSIYKEMPNNAIKNGVPYLASVKAGRTKPDQRSEGFTVAVMTAFKSIEDMRYYDNECSAHAELKEFAKTVHQGVLMVFFENELFS